MDFEFQLDIDPSEINEQELESRGVMPSGWFRAKLTDAFPDMKDNAGAKLVFEISHGAFKTREVKDTLWDPAQSDSDEKKKGATNRMLILTRRMGMRQDNSNHINLRLGIDKEFVIHLVRQRFAWCESCQQEITKEARGNARKCPDCGGHLKWMEREDGFANIDYEGVYPLDHPKIPPNVRKELALPPARAEAGDEAVAGSGTTSQGKTVKPKTPAQKPGGGNGGAASQQSKEERLRAASQGF